MKSRWNTSGYNLKGFHEGLALTPYEELQKAAEASRKRFFNAQNAVFQALGQLTYGLGEQWEAPDDVIVLTKWDGTKHQNGLRAYRMAEAGVTYTVPGATVFDPTDGYWRLGVRITLTKNQLPERYIFFPLTMTFKKGKPWIRDFETQKDIEFDVTDIQQQSATCRKILEHCLQSFAAEAVDFGAGQVINKKNEIGFHAGFGDTMVVDI